MPRPPATTTAAVELIAIAAEEAAQVGAELQARLTALTVQGDERLLRRALRNLLENARRYGGGEITLSAERVAGPPPCAELRVCDRGPGVPEALRERIFEPFFRLPGHAEREGGVGLGLALVKQIAERHGGSVRCEARDGRRQLLRAQPAAGSVARCCCRSTQNRNSVRPIAAAPSRWWTRPSSRVRRAARPAPRRRR